MVKLVTSATDVHRSRTGRPAVLDLRTPSASQALAPEAPSGHQSLANRQLNTTAPARHTTLHQAKIDHAKATPRSPLVAKFGSSAIDTEPVVPIMVAAPAPEPPAASSTPPITASTSPAVTIPTAGSSVQPTPKSEPISEPAAALTTPSDDLPAAEPTWRPHLGLAPRSGRIVTGLTAVIIFAGYIWLHNYPKLALDAANSRAGIEAAMPRYLPANYSLANTATSPGLVTFDFANPNVSEILKIAQARTSWDTHSLLDNFVAKQADSYAAVQGQGLTIYIFNQNQATWVNHGLWYRIEGASKLSREQLLQIAYSM